VAEEKQNIELKYAEQLKKLKTKQAKQEKQCDIQSSD